VEKCPVPGQRLWYARAAVEHGWSRNVMVHQIESRLFERQDGQGAAGAVSEEAPYYGWQTGPTAER